MYFAFVSGQSTGPGVSGQDIDAPRLRAFRFGPGHVLCPQLALVISGYIADVMRPPTVVCCVNVLASRQQSPGIVNTNNRIGKCRYFFGVFFARRGAGRDNSVDFFFALFLGAG